MLPPQKKQTISDSLLWSKLKEGDSIAFREVFDRYSDLMFKYGLTIVKDRELVKDSLQEIFIEIWKHRSSVAFAQSIKFYLLISLRRLLISKNKKIFKTNNVIQLLGFLQRDHFEPDASEKMIETENAQKNQRLISGAIKQLPSRQQEAVFLRFYEGLEYDAIEKIMQLNYQVVRNTIYRAIKSLRLNLEQNKALYGHTKSLTADAPGYDN